MHGLGVLLHIVRKEFLQLLRDKRMIPLVLIGPVIEILVFGYAVNQDVTDVPMVVVDQDHSAASRGLVDRFTGSGYFDLVGVEEEPAAIEPWLVEGRAQIALVIAPRYGARIDAGETPAVQLVADGSDSSSAVVGMGYAAGIVGAASQELVLRRAQEIARATGHVPKLARVDLVPRVWYNPDLRSRWVYVPAVIAMVLMLTTLLLSAMGVVREKEIGTMEQLIVTPIRPWQLIVGKLLPFAVIGLVDVLLITGIAVGWFGVPLRGSLATLVGLSMLFVLNTLGFGLLVSTLVRNQQQAMMLAAFLLMVPFIYLSGLIFPIENMPRPIQWFTWAIPLKYYAIVLRGVFLKGSGIDVLWPQAVAMLAMGLAVLGLASLRFRKRLD